MINTISLTSFKAFGLPVEFNLDSKSMLAYGENGSGKSSLYEAIRLFFYQDRILAGLKKEGQAGEITEADKQNYLHGFNNQIIKADFDLKVNGLKREAFPIDDYAIYMLCNLNVQVGDVLRAGEFLQGITMPTMDVDAFLRDKWATLLQNINKAIHDDFKENFTVSFADVYYTLKIEDATRDVSPEKDYRQYLNEAKLHLVALLLFFESVKLHKDSILAEKSKLLVLDDIVTSLDATNRIFLANYLIRDFSDCQIVLLTHNVSFFNMVHLKLSNTIDGIPDKWVEYNIYETIDDSKAYIYSTMKDAKAILAEYRKTTNRAEVGNQIRRRFEAVMYEFAKLILVDCFEDSGNLLARMIDKNKPIYIHKQGDTVYTSRDLVDAITNTVAGSDADHDKLTTITTEIEKYKKDVEIEKVKNILRELKMFQKVVFHQLSHSTGTMATFTDKEIRHSLELLNYFENQVKSFRHTNIYGM
ncbi:MAG: AAA family ATPase [Prevotella sp.]|nr:AAA family ATPase [Prevotella sp.]